MRERRGARCTAAMLLAGALVVPACLDIADTSSGQSGDPDSGASGTGGTTVDAGDDGSWPSGTVHVQRGSAQLADTHANTVASLAKTDGATSAAFFSTRHALTEPAETLVRGELAGNALSFNRVGSNGPVDVSWQVLTHPAVTVQRGSAVPSAAPTQVPLPSAVDVARSFPIVSWQNGGQNFGTDDFVAAKLSGPTSLDLETAQGQQQISWQVVEFHDGTTVQHGTATLTGTSVSSPVSPAVDAGKAFLVFSSTLAGAGDNQTPSLAALHGSLVGGQSVRFERDATGPAWTIHWSVVELALGSVQAVDVDLPSAQKSTSVGIQPVDPDRTLVVVPSAFTAGSCSGFGMGSASATFELGAGQLTATRSSSWGAFGSTVYVVTF